MVQVKASPVSAIAGFLALSLAASIAAPPAYGQSSATTYQYDALGRLTTVQTGDGVKSTYSFDPADNRANVTVQRQTDTNSSQEKWEAEALPHATGYAEYSGWAANTGQPVTAMVYGPYTNGVPAGGHTAVWRIMIDNNSNPSPDAVVVLDVNDADANQVLASRALTWTSFAAPMAYQVFELPFTVDSTRVGHHLEFRVWYERKAYINVDWVARI
jgi:YD repeat-containing protein